jgi:hypothetical protein
MNYIEEKRIIKSGIKKSLIYLLFFISILLLILLSACSSDSESEVSSFRKEDEELSPISLYLNAGNRLRNRIILDQDRILLERIRKTAYLQIKLYQFNRWTVSDRTGHIDLLLNLEIFLDDPNLTFDRQPNYLYVTHHGHGSWQYSNMICLDGQPYPGIILEEYDDHFRDMIDKDYYLHIDEIFKRFPFFKAAHGEQFWEVNNLRTEGYGIPLYSFHMSELPGFWLIKKDCVEHSGIKKMETLEDFTILFSYLLNHMSDTMIYTAGVPAGSIWLDMQENLMPVEVPCLSKIESEKDPVSGQISISKNLVPSPLYYDSINGEIVNITENPPDGLPDFLKIITALNSQNKIDQSANIDKLIPDLMANNTTAVYVPRDSTHRIIKLFESYEEMNRLYDIVPLTLNSVPKISLLTRNYLAVPKKIGVQPAFIKLLETVTNKDAWEDIRFVESNENGKNTPNSIIRESAVELITRNCNFDRFGDSLPEELQKHFTIDDRDPSSYKLFPVSRREMHRLKIDVDTVVWKNLYTDFKAIMEGRDDFSAGAERLNSLTEDILNAVAEEVRKHIQKSAR